MIDSAPLTDDDLRNVLAWPLTDLTLLKVPISRQLVLALNASRNLKRLTIIQTRLDDDFPYAFDNQGLDSVTLLNTGLTKDQVNELQRRLPTTTIEHRND